MASSTSQSKVLPIHCSSGTSCCSTEFSLISVVFSSLMCSLVMYTRIVVVFLASGLMDCNRFLCFVISSFF